MLKWLIRFLFFTIFSRRDNADFLVCIVESMGRQTGVLLYCCSTKSQNSSVTCLRWDFTVRFSCCRLSFPLFHSLFSSLLITGIFWKAFQRIGSMINSNGEEKKTQHYCHFDTNSVSSACNRKMFWKENGALEHVVIFSSSYWQESAAAKLNSGIFFEKGNSFIGTKSNI